MELGLEVDDTHAPYTVLAVEIKSPTASLAVSPEEKAGLAGTNDNRTSRWGVAR